MKRVRGEVRGMAIIAPWMASQASQGNDIAALRRSFIGTRGQGIEDNSQPMHSASWHNRARAVRQPRRPILASSAK